MELLQMELEFWLDDLEEGEVQSLVDLARGTNLAKRLAEYKKKFKPHSDGEKNEPLTYAAF